VTAAGRVTHHHPFHPGSSESSTAGACAGGRDSKVPADLDGHHL